MIAGDRLVIVPSRGRSGSVARLLDAVHATAKMNAHVHVAVDDDDPELERYRYVMSQAAGDGDRLTTGPRKGLAAWTNEIAVERAAEYPFLASLGDDHVPYTKEWDRALMRAIAETGGTGFSYPCDGIREAIPEAVVLSGDTVQALGWFCLPGLSHWFVDNVWADLGRGAGCLRHLHAIKVEHAWKGDQTSAENSTSYAADSTATAYAVGPSTATAASTWLYSSANGSGTGTYATYGAVLWSQTTPCTAGANWGEWFMPGFELNTGNSPGTLLAVTQELGAAGTTSNVNLMPELVISE